MLRLFAKMIPATDNFLGPTIFELVAYRPNFVNPLFSISKLSTIQDWKLVVQEAQYVFRYCSSWVIRARQTPQECVTMVIVRFVDD